MCGIAGVLSTHWSSDRCRTICDTMSEAIAHRGPDDSGSYAPDDAGIALVHRRLSIIDTSSAGHQPMASPSGRWIVVFNGEIYNADELRKQSDSSTAFRGHSDTEILCDLIDRVGPQAAAEHSVGMFAFAAWDTVERRLFLVRDRIGIKPLYYVEGQGVIGFASEMRALQRVPEFRGSVSNAGLAALLRFGYVPGPLSIRSNIKKLAPGSMLVATPGKQSVHASLKQWWSIKTTVGCPVMDVDDAEAIELVRNAIDDSVQDRLVSDRPLGAFLSGGIDSSLVVGTMARLADGPVKSYSIGFHQAGYDEANHARAVADHLGTDHTEQYVEERDAIDLIPQMGALFDEPFADSSQIPTLMVCMLARQDVVVALSGDGGDELFGGYERYAWATRLWTRLSKVPLSARKAMAMGLVAIPPRLASSLGTMANRCVPQRFRVRNPSDKVRLLSQILGATSAANLYQLLIGHWKQPNRILATSLSSNEQPSFPHVPSMDNTHEMMMMDLLGYLPDDILVKVDRTSMSVGLEARVPLLDHRIVELAWQLPMNVKIRDGEGKWILRRILEDMVPKENWDRPKQGFSVPIGQWLRGPLRDWAEALIAEDRLNQEGFFKPKSIRKAWDRHLDGTLDLGPSLWDILMFQSWLDANG